MLLKIFITVLLGGLPLLALAQSGADVNSAAKLPRRGSADSGIATTPSGRVAPPASSGTSVMGSDLGTGGIPAVAGSHPPPVGRSTRCDLLSGLEKDRCVRDEAPAGVGAGSAERVGPGSVGMGAGR